MLNCEAGRYTGKPSPIVGDGKKAMDAKQKLDLYAEYRAEADAVKLKKQELIDSVLTPEIKARIAEIESEFSMPEIAVSEKLTAIEAEIRQDVLANGATVTGDYFQAVFSKGRVSWDGKKLDGMMAIIPGLEAARSVGAPSVSIRSRK